MRRSTLPSAATLADLAPIGTPVAARTLVRTALPVVAGTFLRTALPVVAAILALAVPPAAASAQDAPTSPERYRTLARELLRELVDINTTESSGSETEAARAMQRRLLDAGFPAGDLFVGGPVPDEHNLVARLPGRDPSLKPLILLAHVDVVEADPADWSTDIDPFRFMEREGFFYGRGTTDDKDEAAIYVANLIRMKDEGFTPDRDILVALTADEEGGGDNGVAWLLENHEGFADAAYALNEGGGGMERGGVKVSNNVQASEKKYLSFTFEATNPGGHSSLPRADNAIYDLSRALLAVSESGFPVMLSEVQRAYFEGTAAITGGSEGAAMRRLLEDPDDAAALAVLERIPAYNSRLRTTCVATQLAGGHANNALPQRATATVNCRILQEHPWGEVHARLQELAGPDVRVTPQGSGARMSPSSPLTDEVMGPIRRITEEMWPGTPVLPVMSTGATDALYLRGAGIPVYGVSGIFGDMDNTRAHGQDERIEASHFFEGQEFLYRLAKALTSPGVS
ncbi:MAG: M20/M25/M40 family metallo-hydrolase [Gemmatimonadetes bacterium]|nr:M20/M25/M40 family metallo-hydrolase [Gemmatimonadota bacterium]